jgi:hypothetical protein
MPSRSPSVGRSLALRAGWSEYDDRLLDSRVTELPSLCNGRNAESPGIQRLERLDYGDNAKPVGIRLDHGEERYAGAIKHCLRIAQESVEVDLDPGARARVRLAGHGEPGKLRPQERPCKIKRDLMIRSR